MATDPDVFANSNEARLYTAITTPIQGGNDEAVSLMDAAEPLTPPNPNRFSMLSPSIGGSLGSQRDSLVSDANSSRPIAGASAALMGAGLGVGAAGSPDTSGVTSIDASKERVVDESAEPIIGTGAVKGGNRRRIWWIAAAVGLLIVAAAVAIPVALVVGNKDSKSTTSSSSSPSNPRPTSSGTNTPPTVAVITGGDGSTVTTDDGSTFTYVNKLGGYWVDDPSNPFNNDARPNSWTPPLNTSWQWGVDKVYGVNLGGLFVLEPFIVPALFQKYLSAGAQDEWTLSQAMAADTASGGLNQLEEHYNTFITEEDIAQIAGAGLNWIRLPVPFWAIDDWKTPSLDEPFLARTCWKYILRLLRWCRKYGLRVNLDLHTAPGSQNGYNHSGKSGQINFLRGVMGFANAQRMLGYIRIFTEFISQPEYKDVVPMFGIINEPRVSDIGQDILSNFYLQVYEMMRGITGIGEGNGPYISYHDGFAGLAQWADFLPGADRISLDVHPYFAFNGQPNTDPIDVWPARACNAWAAMMNTSQTSFGVTIAGEFSNGINDCGLFLNGVQDTHNYGGDCGFWEDSTQWNQTIIDGLKDFTLASFDSLQDWFYWTWKIGNSTAGRVQTPLWSYKAGLEGGWIPADPRVASGTCASLGVSGPVFDGTFNSWATGGAGAGTISANALASFTAWPPSSMSGVSGSMNFIPTYTATGTVSTLPPDSDLLTRTPTPTTSIGDGWADGSDTTPGVTEVAGCSYPNAWDASSATMPTAACTGSAAARFAKRTPPPVV